MGNDDLNDLQRYLVEEEAEHWHEGEISRREFIRRVLLLLGGGAAATSVLLSYGCDTNSVEPTATSIPAPTATTAPPPTATTAPPPTATTAAASTPSPAAAGQATPSGGAAAASPYHVEESDPTIKAEMVDIPSPDPAAKLRGYLAVPATLGAGQRVGGVLVIHENRGLTEHIKDVVRRVAKAGYVGLGVDLLSRAGGTVAFPDEAARSGVLSQSPPEQLVADLGAGVDYLKSRGEVNPASLGAVGFCFGGGMTWRLATQRPDLKAAVPFYGPNPPLTDVPKIQAAVLGIYGGTDARITGQVPALEAALKAANVKYEIQIFPGAAHAFHNDTGTNYKPDAAKEAWERALAWFQGHL